MKLLIVAALFAVASARSTHLLGDEECTMGPSYWCKNYQTAKQCGAAKYCTDKVWQKQTKNSMCDTCKEVVGVVHAYLANNLTETELVQSLEALCSFLGSYSTECKTIVGTYGKEIMTVISEYTANPTMICQMLGICKAQGTVKVQNMAMMQKVMPIVFAAKEKIQQPGSSALCIVCEFAMTELDNYLKEGATEAKITEYVEKICSYLPSTVKTECDALITEYGKEIIQLLVNEMKPKAVCAKLKLCSSATVKVAQPKPKGFSSGESCQLCELLVTYVEKMVNNNTEAEIKKVLDELCSYLGSAKDECQSIVNTYVPTIIELLKKELTPALVCKELGLCTTLNSLLGKSKISVGNGTYCPYCKLVVTYIDNMLKDQKTEAEITAVLEQLCSYLGTYKTECESIMSTYLPIVFKYLAQELSPDLVCKELGLCTAAKPLSIKLMKSPKAVKKVGGIECEACEYIVTYVESLLNTKTEAEIIAMADKICAYVGSYKTECEALIKAYLPEIIDLLKKELTPSLVCKELGLCTALKRFASKSLKISKPIKKACSLECEACEYVVTYVDSLLNTKTEAEIVAMADKLCMYVGTYKSECESLIKAYLPEIIELLKKELSPALVCKELGLCTALKGFMTKINLSGISGGTYCPYCKLVVTYVDNMLKDQKTEAEITAELEKLCSLLGTYKTECTSLMSTYLPLVFKYLAQELSPDLVCKELGLCTAAKKLESKAVKAIKITKTKNVGNVITCELCEYMVGYVKTLLNTKTEAEIVAMADKLCSYVGVMKSECDTLVKSYLPKILELLKQELTPALVCKELGLCTVMNKMVQNIKLSGPRSTTYCTFCKLIVSYADAELKNQKTEAEITAVLERLCSFLSSYKTECQSYMSAYLPLVFKYLAQEMTPELVCKELTLCTSATNNVKSKFIGVIRV